MDARALRSEEVEVPLDEHAVFDFAKLCFATLNERFGL